MSNIEILAPAGSPECLIAALNTGADAVYLGIRSEKADGPNINGFSARQNAKNFTTDELYEAASTCRLSGVKLYVALNTLILDDEIEQVKEVVNTALAAGVDAFIIQDLALLEIIRQAQETTKPARPCKLHASTQMTINSTSGVLAAKSLGLSRVVLARELSFSEIVEITRAAENAGMETEVFVHGALCVSVSGQCYMSGFFGGSGTDRRSANRGLCAQPCRLNFSAGETQNALSLKDLSIVGYIERLQQAGVTSVKIEGRMKRPEYVAAAVSACRQGRDGEFSDGTLLKAAFSRDGFTDGYFTGNITEMRGFRGREDVLQTEGALKELQGLYKAPFKRGKLNIRLIVDSSEIICAADYNGISVDLKLSPAEAALTRQTTSEEIIGRLSKLGGTIFEPGEITCDIEDNLYLSAARVNEIRRRIILEIERTVAVGADIGG